MKIFCYVITFLTIASISFAQEAKLETLLKAKLEGVKGTEIVVSKVVIPPNTSLPKHWHPGEEFVYILAGSATLIQQDKEDILGEKGDVIKVPFKQIHAGVAGDQGVTMLVFRVHEEGQPERVLVE